MELSRGRSAAMELPDLASLGLRPVALDAVRSTLAESPRWDPVSNTLWWVDILGSALHRLAPGPVQTSWDLDIAAGAVILTDGPEIILAAADGFHLVEPDTGASRLIATLEPDLLSRRMNDAGVDSLGRIYAGTMRWDAGIGPDDGVLYRLDRDGRVEPLLRGLGCPNGLAWIRGDLLAFIDSLAKRIDFWNVDIPSGSLLGIASSIDTSTFDGIPDGMTLDSAGRLWVAFWGGGVVRSFEHDGEVHATIEVGTPFVSSVCFGGDDLRTLFMTTARDDDRTANPADDHGGSLFACRPGATGAEPFRWSAPSS